MQVSLWIGIYVTSGLFWIWVLNWGGADWLEGWKAWFSIGWFAGLWNAEQLRLYALLMFWADTVWFVVSIFVPGLRWPLLH